MTAGGVPITIAISRWSASWISRGLPVYGAPSMYTAIAFAGLQYSPTHVANTREVGRIRVTGYESKGRINKRIRIELIDPGEPADPT